jgi:hypothetical protein
MLCLDWEDLDSERELKVWVESVVGKIREFF